MAMLRRRVALLALAFNASQAAEMHVTADGRATHATHAKESVQTPYGSSFGNLGGMDGMGGGYGFGGGGMGSGGPAPVSSYPSAPASPYGAASYGQGSYGQGSMAPVRAASPGAPAAPGLHTAYAPTETELHMPLNANVELESDDGIFFSSKPQSRPENYDYDDNTVLGTANYIYKGSARRTGGCLISALLMWLALL